MILETEIFKETSWIGILVNSRGEVRKSWTHGNAKKHPTIYLDKDGYKRVWAKDEMGKPKFVTLHRLVALAFLGVPSKGHVVNHKNGIRTDNRVSNLEWLLPADNERHARRVLGKRCVGEKASRSKITSDSVRSIRNMKASGITIKEISASFGISVSQARRILNRKNWGHVE